MGPHPDDDALVMATELAALLTATAAMLRQALGWHRQASHNARRRAADEEQG